MIFNISLTKISILLIIGLTCISQINSQVVCASYLTCLNGGVFNTNTCVCQCFPNWTGVVCATLVCTKPDPVNCSNFISSCAVSFIASYCPNMCGLCSPTTTTTTTTSTTTSTCAATLSCLNGGYLSPTTCTCQCTRNFLNIKILYC